MHHHLICGVPALGLLLMLGGCIGRDAGVSANATSWSTTARPIRASDSVVPVPGTPTRAIPIPRNGVDPMRIAAQRSPMPSATVDLNAVPTYEMTPSASTRAPMTGAASGPGAESPDHD